MGNKLRFLIAAAVVALLSTNAMAQDTDTKKERVSSDGSYQFSPSWGVGLQYGMTFTEMTNWNDYLLIPSKQNYFDVNFVAEHELYGEWTPVEGFRISAFFGYQSLYITDTGFSLIYGGIEPAYSVRRSFYEFAVGIGLGYGYSMLDSDVNDQNGHGLLVRPFVEARFYPADIFAIYLRVAFGFYKEFGLDLSDYTKARDIDRRADADKLTYAGPNVAVGIRFGDYKTPVVSIGDRDGDGVLDDIDECIDIPGTAEYYGCPNPDTDGDGLCDPWVAEMELSETFAHICTGIDHCPELSAPGSVDGCPNPDTDADGLCDPWVAEMGLSEKYAHICTGTDLCPNELPELAAMSDEHGCPNPDTDGDGLCDPWVSEMGLSEKYADICTGVDLCPTLNVPGGQDGCPNPDPDGDSYCDPWVYDHGLQDHYKCKGKDYCPNEKGDDDRGCITRRVVVTADKIQINERIYFALGKAAIKKESDNLLEEIAQVLKDNPQIKKIEIQGHTDLSGRATSNQRLSEGRANSVRDRLVRLGVEKSRMVSKGYGMTQPIIPLAVGQKKEGAEAAATNRRVEFIILEQDVKQVVVPVGTSEKDQEKLLKKSDTTSTIEVKTTPQAEIEQKTQAAKAKDDAKAKAAKARADARAAKAKAEADAKAAKEKAKADAKAAKAKVEADAKAAKAKAEADAKAAKAAAEKTVTDKVDASKAKAEADAKAVADKAAAEKAKLEADAKAAADKAAAAKAKAETDAAAAKAAAEKAAADKAAATKAKAETDAAAAKAAAEKAAAEKAAAAKAKAEADAAAAKAAAEKAAAERVEAAKAKAKADLDAAKAAAEKAAAEAKK